MVVAGTTRDGAERGARDVADSAALTHLARVGLVAYGVVHLLVAFLALQLAWGGGGGSADQSGALAAVAAQPFGRGLLWVLAVGLAALALWQLGETLAARARGGKEGALDAAKAVAKAVVFAALAFSCARFAAGGSSSSTGEQQQATAGVFGLPAGRWLVGLAALVVIGVGVYQGHKALSRGFLDEVDLGRASAAQRRLVERLGLVGGAAKGAAFVVVGGLLGWAAVTVDPAKATGLDGAMRTILAAPFGQVLLTLVALGIAAYGAYCFLRARFPART